ncbi:hypothetical protein [Gorillibacterium timonense]|uniref:hypothetical protein n=1 Tax=Gorillibacterium timonense TaxID=1689269 RepID=UPI00071E0896|nr:hypothetical protein [Gorillibacterium timonense]
MTNRLSRRLSSCFILFLCLTLIGSPLLSIPISEAAGTAIRDGSVTFSVDDAVLSADASTVTLQFQLKVTNGGKSAVRMNDYGVRVVRSGSGSLAAKLLTKQTGKLEAGKMASSRYAATVPAGSKLTEFSIVVFKWNSGSGKYMTDIGQVNAAKAVTSVTSLRSLALSQADSSLSDQLSVQWKTARTYRMVQDDQVYLYADLWLTNKSQAQIALPSSLAYRIQTAGSSSGLSYDAEVVSGNDRNLQPGEVRKVTMRAPIPSTVLTAKGLNLQFYANSQGIPLILGSVLLADAESVGAIGEAQPYLASAAVSPLVFTVKKTTLSALSVGVQFVSTVEVRNTGNTPVTVPTLSASYQYQGLGATEAAPDTGSHPAYLTAGSSSTYTFTATLPADVRPSDARLVLMENKAAKTSAAAATGSSTAAAVALPAAIIALDTASEPKDALTAAKAYSLGSVLKLDDAALPSGLKASLLELKEYTNPDTGYRTAVGKYRLTNTGSAPIALPAFANELITKNGVYPGTRQSGTVQTILPGTSYLTAYSYILPDSEEGTDFALNVYDGSSSSTSGDKSSFGSFKVKLQSDSMDSSLPYTMSFYPYELNVLSKYGLNWSYDTSSGTYTGQVRIDVSSSRVDNVTVEQSFTGIEFDLIDRKTGISLGAVSYSLSGTSKLKDGQITLKFSGVTSGQIGWNALQIYETIPTPNGTVKRLMLELPSQ